MTKRELTTKLIKHKGYLRWGNNRLASKFGLSARTCKMIKEEITNYFRSTGTSY